MARIRKNVLSLSSGDATVSWYGKAVAEMQKKPITDPTSWRYQSAIHDYDTSTDPFAVPGEILPSNAEQLKYWQKCQHGSWYFLPWHRIYLHFFEQIVLGHVIALGGPKDWALPYWNYSASTSAAMLPPPFRNPTLAGGGNNPLYVADRDPNANAGLTFASPSDTDISYCLTRTTFPGGPVGGSAGFAGPVTVFHHAGGSTGSLENIPHGSIHGAVAGASGWMGDFTTAPLDPIFWLHHCNIDRLWEVWLHRDPTHVNPTTANWLTSVLFDFHDATGSPATMTPAQVVNTQPAPLDYVYDDTNDPLAPAVPFAAALPAGAASAKATTMTTPSTGPSTVVPEMIGASTSFSLDKVPTHQAIALQKPTGPASQPGGAGMLTLSTPRPQRVFLQIEGITSSDRSVPYDVYINLPPNADPSQKLTLHAGRLSMFGVRESSIPGNQHPGDGLSYTLEITDLYDRLNAAGEWDPQNLRISFIPTRTDGGTSAKVGRVSVYFA